MRCGTLDSSFAYKGQATTLQVIIFIAILTISGSLLISIFNSLSRTNLAPLMAIKIARIVDEAEGVVGLRFEVHIKITFLANGTIIVETSNGIGKAQVTNKSLVPSSVEGVVIYIVSNATHASIRPNRG